MREMTCALAVIGGGPGGYTCAERAARLGVDTVLIESDRLGGTCLNIGCIPSKALIHAAGLYATARTQAGAGVYGVHVASSRLDFGQTQAWIDGVTGRLRGGVQAMMERGGVKTLAGRARFRDGKTLDVRGETGAIRLSAGAEVIATGARAVELSGLPFGGRVVDSTGALALAAAPERLAVVGAGYIGQELGTAFAKLGSAVKLIEPAHRPCRSTTSG